MGYETGANPRKNIDVMEEVSRYLAAGKTDEKEDMDTETPKKKKKKDKKKRRKRNQRKKQRNKQSFWKLHLKAVIHRHLKRNRRKKRRNHPRKRRRVKINNRENFLNFRSILATI